MAIIIKDYKTKTTDGTLSLSFSGKNRGCIVIICQNDSTSGDPHIISIACDGKTMIQAGTIGYDNNTAYGRLWVYYYINPGIGTKNIILDTSIAQAMKWGAYAVSGIRQSLPVSEVKCAGGHALSSPQTLTFSAADTNGIIIYGKSDGYAQGQDFNTIVYPNIEKKEAVQLTAYNATYGFGVIAVSFHAISGGSGVSFGPYFRLFKNFELPWKKQGSLWLPNNEGIQTI